MANIVGQTLLNQFRVDAFVASGGMGAVYRVWDMKRNVPLAMKVLHSDLAEDPSMFKRFQREANALKKLTHPNIVPFYGLYKTGEFDFLLERFIDGPSLKVILKQRQGKPLEVTEALVYFKALCAALGYAHANGVVHCDVKPGNVMVDRGGSIYLTDFGIARHAESTTTTMGTAGTAAYMAPEQIRGEAVSPATDVYALGVMLFEMLTGQRPFRGTEESTERGGTTANERIRYGHLNLQPPDPQSINPNLPAGLSEVILKTLSKKPKARYASTQALFTEACAGFGTVPSELPGYSAVQDDLPLQPDYTDAREVNAGLATALQRIAHKLRLGKTARFLIIVCIFLAIGGVAYALTMAKPTSVSTIPSLLPVSYTVSPLQTAVQPLLPQPLTEIPSPVPTDAPMDTPIHLETGLTTVSPQDEMVMVYVPAGDFLMGAKAGDLIEDANELPQHTINLDAFWIDRTEITNGMFAKFVQATGYQTDAERFGTGTALDFLQGRSSWDPARSGVSWQHPNNPSDNIDNLSMRPVVQVSWNDASAYCKWVNRRLPTEAEWEKAARGEDGNIYPWGNEDPNADLLNFDLLVGHLTDVGSYPAGASPYGALDMLGNAYEWVFDWYDSNYYSHSPASNPQGPISGSTHIIRGGSWNYGVVWTHTTSRSKLVPTARVETLGFRCSLDANP
jgi:serine/threonine-protein kinase